MYRYLICLLLVGCNAQIDQDYDGIPDRYDKCPDSHSHDVSAAGCEGVSTQQPDPSKQTVLEMTSNHHLPSKEPS